MKYCPNCDERMSDNRELCRECTKEKHWEGMKWQQAEQLFSPRIVKTLKELEPSLKLDEKDVRVGSGLYLYGPAGTGKTIYASAILMELKRRSFLSYHSPYIRGRFVNVLNLLEEVKAGFNQPDYWEPMNIIERYSNADVLIMDDIGGQKVTEWVLSTLILIINNRYENLKPTIFTSNADLNDLSRQYEDDRIPSRIVEMCRIKQFTNKDYRISK